MKLNRVLWVLILVGLSAGVAKADGDPFIKWADPSCDGPNVIDFGASGTVQVTLSADMTTQDLCYVGQGTLTTVTLVFDATTGEAFTFSGGDVFPDSSTSPSESTYPVLPCPPCTLTQWTVVFSGADVSSGTGLALSEEGLTGDDTLSMDVTAPEPSTLPLLLMGLVPLFFFRKRFRDASDPI